MKLITFSENQRTRLGLLTDAGVIDLSLTNPELPQNMLAFIEAGEEAFSKAREANQLEAHFPLAEVTLQAPLKRPPKILAIGLNYRAHAEESGAKIPKWPVVFTKQATSAAGPYYDIYLPPETTMLDYEGELGIVIGKRCRRVPKEKAKEVIAGYCVVNDVSVRNWQLRGDNPQFTMGKSWDSHCPFGPAIVSGDEVDPHALRLQTWVNDEVRQDSSTDDLIFNCFDIIEFLSTAFTLEPGDLIATGTPSGVGMAMKPPRPLQVGDRVRVEIAGLGYIENTVAPEPDTTARW